MELSCPSNLIKHFLKFLAKETQENFFILHKSPLEETGKIFNHVSLLT